MSDSGETLHAAMRFLADFHGDVNDSQVGVPEDYRGFALELLHALEGAHSGRSDREVVEP